MSPLDLIAAMALAQGLSDVILRSEATKNLPLCLFIEARDLAE
jgi:hypothetical protein